MTESEKHEFERQRTQAEQRMRELYSVSGNKLPTPPNTPPMPPFLRRPETTNIPNAPPRHDAPVSHVPQVSPHRPHAPEPPPSKGFDLLGMLNFKNFELDSDRVLILAMALLLSTEKIDEMLMLALLYIML